MKEGNQSLEPCNAVGRNKLSVAAANASATLVYLSRKHFTNKHYVNTKPKRITIQEKQQLILKQQLTLKLQQQQQPRQHLLNRIKENYKIIQLNSLILVIILANLLVLLSANNKFGVLASPKLAFDSSEYNRDNQHERQYYDSAVDVVGSDSNSGGNSNNEQQQPSQIRARAEQLPDSVYKMAPFLFGADIIPDYFTEPADRVSQSVNPKSSSGLKPAKRILTTTSVNNAAAATSSREVRPEMVLPMKTQMIRTIKPRSAPLMLPSSPPSPPPPPQQTQTQSQQQQQQPMMMMMMAMPEEGANQLKMSNNNNNNSDTNNLSEPVMKEQVTKPNPGMDHVLSSLELVVEAMKQQTMAMAMISGQMAAKSPEKQPDQQQQLQQPVITPQATNPVSKDKDAKEILESFGEVMGGLRNSRQVGGAAKPQMASLILDSFGEPIMLQPVKGGAQIKTENDQAVFINQQDLFFDAPSKGGKTATTSSTTTTSTTPIPTTTTTTTTQKPTTTTTARPTTISTTTTTTPVPSSTSTSVQATISTTSKSTEQTATTTLNPFQSIYKNPAAFSGIPSPDMKGWRRVLPFDYYSMTQHEQQDTAGSVDAKQPGAGHMTRSVSLTYPSVGSSMVQQQHHQQHQPQQMMAPADNYRSVSMPAQGYPGNHQAMMMMMNGATYNTPNQQQQQQQSYMDSEHQRYMDSENQRMMLLATLMQHPKMMNNMMQYQMANGKQMTQEMTPQMMQMMADAMANNAYQHQAPTAAAQQPAMQPPPAMMVHQVATTPSPMSMGRPTQTMQNMMMQMAQQDMSFSDEIPKPPGLQSTNMEGMGGGGGSAGSGDMFGIPNMSKTSAGTKSSIKIGDRPQFDPNNFQLLIAADVNQQKKAQMMKLAQQMSSAMSQQQKQQQQESDNQDNQSNEDGPGSSNDLSGGASEKNVQKLPEKSPQKLAVNPGAPEMVPQEMSTTSTKTNGFSILGGRFKITPHTQMLHWVLDPTKVLLQQTLGTWMAGGSGGGGSSQFQVGVPISQKRIPRRNPTSGQRPSSASTSKVRKNTTKASSSHSNQASSSPSTSSSSQTSSSSSSKSSQSARNQARGAKGAGKSTRSN